MDTVVEMGETNWPRTTLPAVLVVLTTLSEVNWPVAATRVPNDPVAAESEVNDPVPALREMKLPVPACTWVAERTPLVD